MESLYLLIPLSVLAVVVAALLFFWMNRSGQFDDDQGPAWSILLDDDRPVQRPDEARQADPDATSDEDADPVDHSGPHRDDAASGRHDS